MSPTSAYAGRPAYDPRLVRRIFDRRAASFDDVAFCPREIAKRMRERLDYIKVTPTRVLDAGCGQGADLPALRERFAEASVLGADLSGAMLAKANVAEMAESEGERRLAALPARPRLARLSARAGPQLAQADFAQLPFAAGAFELLWSNLALHWHARPDLVFPRMAARAQGSTAVDVQHARARYPARAERCVRPGRDVARPRARPHTIDFVDMHDLGDMLVESGFEIPVMDQEVVTITYKSPESLLKDVRRWGAYPPGWRASASSRSLRAGAGRGARNASPG